MLLLLQSAKSEGGIYISSSHWWNGLIIDPRTSFMKFWDGFVMVLLIFTAYVTPYEVAFLETRINFLFFINRFVDCVFFLDMVSQVSVKNTT
jgi:hypothetical protein